MKRTKEAYFRYHPEPEQTQGCSGLKEFEGEDLSYDARTKFNKDQQKQWIEQQIAEKKWKKDQERLEEQAYAQQTLELNRMRGMLEDDFNRKKADIRNTMKETNLQFAKTKIDQDKQQTNDKLMYETSEVNLTKERGMKKPFP